MGCPRSRCGKCWGGRRRSPTPVFPLSAARTPPPRKHRAHRGSGRPTEGPHPKPADFHWGEPPPALPSSTASAEKITWLALTPVTGRTHQLRVHCAARGWPIVGDNIYGTAQRFIGPPQLLHAREVVVPISKNKAPVRVTAPVPAHMRNWLIACGWNDADPETQ